MIRSAMHWIENNMMLGPAVSKSVILSDILDSLRHKVEDEIRMGERREKAVRDCRTYQVFLNASLSTV